MYSSPCFWNSFCRKADGPEYLTENESLSSSFSFNVTILFLPNFKTLVTAITRLYIHHTLPLPPTLRTDYNQFSTSHPISTHIQHHPHELTDFSADSGMAPTYTVSLIQPHTPSYTLWSVNKEMVGLLFILQNFLQNLRLFLEHWWDISPLSFAPRNKLGVPIQYHVFQRWKWKQRTQRKLTQKWGEHANSNTVSNLSSGLNHKPWICEASTLTAAPSCHHHWAYSCKVFDIGIPFFSLYKLDFDPFITTYCTLWLLAMHWSLHFYLVVV